jgi:hypothetical protein
MPVSFYFLIDISHANDYEMVAGFDFCFPNG